jgi:hypothetical protein
MRRWLSALTCAAAAAVALGVTLSGAEPGEGAISRDARSVTWAGGPFTASNPAGCAAGASDPTCDHFRLSVNAPNRTTFMVGIQTPEGSGDDFDLFVYYPDGSEAASSASSGGKESVVVEHRTDKGTGPYEVRVQPWLVTASGTYNGIAVLQRGTPTDVTRECLEPVPAAVGVGGVTDTGQPIAMNLIVLLDGVSRESAASKIDRTAAAYRSVNMPFSVTFRSVTFNTDDAEALIQLAKNLYGGSRPEGTDLVYVLTSKNIQSGGNDGVAGLADCIGGVRYPTRAFAVGEDFPGNEQIGPFTLMIDATAKIAAHELGHLMGAHHHYANCVEGLTTEGEYRELSPCTLMFNFVDFQSINFSLLNQAVVRGHATSYAAP